MQLISVIVGAALALVVSVNGAYLRTSMEALLEDAGNANNDNNCGGFPNEDMLWGFVGQMGLKNQRGRIDINGIESMVTMLSTFENPPHSINFKDQELKKYVDKLFVAGKNTFKVVSYIYFIDFY